MANIIFISLLFYSNLIAFKVIATEITDRKTLTENPKTFEKLYHVIVLVDVKVNKIGQAIEVKLSQPERHTSFNALALSMAKKRKYSIKVINGIPIEHWLKNVEFKQSISSLGTKAELPKFGSSTKISQ